MRYRNEMKKITTTTSTTAAASSADTVINTKLKKTRVDAICAALFLRVI